jgi:hypothetical protein
MAVGMLQTFEYPEAGPWREERTAHPIWPQVEASVRRLDGDRFPTVGLFFDDDAAPDDVPDFELLGGKIGYVVTARPSGGGEFWYRGDSAQSEEVEVWVSDQRFVCPRFMVCPDVEGVVAATRCFFETGQLLEDFPWSSKFG